MVSDIQGAEFPVFSNLADSGLAKRIDTVRRHQHIPTSGISFRFAALFQNPS